MPTSRRGLLAATGGIALAASTRSALGKSAISGIDHLVIMFKELEPAMSAYRDLGFTVVPGGEHGDRPSLAPYPEPAWQSCVTVGAQAL